MTLCVDITAQTIGKIGIDIQAQTIGAIDINIAASAVKLAITINAGDITGNLPIDITAQTVGNIGIDIKAQTVSQLNVNIAASAATITVSVTGIANFSIVAQEVGVYLQPEWAAKEGNDKNFYLTAVNMGWHEGVYASYVVPSGKTLYLCGLSFRIAAADAANYDHHLYGYASLIDWTADINLATIGGLGGGGIPCPKPVTIPEGHEFKLELYCEAGVDCHLLASSWGYEI